MTNSMIWTAPLCLDLESSSLQNKDDLDQIILILHSREKSFFK